MRPVIKLHFRTTLLIALVGIVGIAVAFVGFGSYHNARAAADELATQVLDQTSERIKARIVSLLETASIQGELTHKLLLNPDVPPYERPTSTNFPAITAYFHEVMKM